MIFYPFLVFSKQNVVEKLKNFRRFVLYLYFIYILYCCKILREFCRKNREEIRILPKWGGEYIRIFRQNIYPWGVDGPHGLFWNVLYQCCNNKTEVEPSATSTLLFCTWTCTFCHFCGFYILFSCMLKIAKIWLNMGNSFFMDKPIFRHSLFLPPWGCWPKKYIYPYRVGPPEIWKSLTKIDKKNFTFKNF